MAAFNVIRVSIFENVFQGSTSNVTASYAHHDFPPKGGEGRHFHQSHDDSSPWQRLSEEGFLESRYPRKPDGCWTKRNRSVAIRKSEARGVSVALNDHHGQPHQCLPLVGATFYLYVHSYVDSGLNGVMGSYLINSPNSMTTSRPSTPVMKECDSAAALSTQCNPSAGTATAILWPRTQLILETPERKRLRYALQNGGIYTTPPKRAMIATPRTPVTPKRPARSGNMPGENMFDECPSPLRRFRISQSTTPLSEKYANAVAGTEYRFQHGETLSITPSKEVKDIDDSPNSPVSTIHAQRFAQTSSTGVTLTNLDDSGISSMDLNSTLDSSNWCSSTFDESAYFSVDMFDDSFDNYHLNTETENSMDCDSWVATSPGYDVPSNDSPVPDKTPVVPETPVCLHPNDDGDAEVQPCTSEKPCSSASLTHPEATVLDDPQKPDLSRASSTVAESAPPSSSTVSKTRTNQKDIADEIHFLLDQYDNVSFNEDAVENVDMTEFRKLKLMSSTTSNWYKTVLGRSREQIEVTREAHRHLNQLKRVKSRK
uniref:PP1c_bdg domain-containing protein n=1 Tax=Panagrellus redivivus TaxID=6233 RepID=A0A7E4UX58_PANRE